MRQTAPSPSRSRPLAAALAAALAALAALAGSARAEFVLAPQTDRRLSALEVEDEHGARGELRALSAGVPTLLLPVFTRCMGSCPVTTEALRAALARAGTPFRVVLFTFDPEDRAQDLRDFRAGHELPSDWQLVRGVDAGAARAFLDGLGFAVMKATEGYVHPDVTYAVSPGGVWAGTFYGPDFPRAELERALRVARGADNPTLAGRLARPESWIALAGAGLLAILGGAFSLARRARRRS